MRTIPLFVAAALAAVSPAHAQDTAAATPRDSTLRVFLDCQGFDRGCDFDFMRTEITFVNWARQREDADVHLLITAQETGGGGREHTLAFIGLGAYRGRVDTLQYFSGATDTEDDVRKGLVRVIKLGLIPFVARTPAGRQISISYSAPTGAAAAQPRDPWNYWFFRLSLNGNVFGEALSTSVGLFGNISASRVTETWKLQFNVFPNYNYDKFIFQEFDSTGALTFADTTESTSRSYGGNALIARSVTKHWSVGGQVSGRRETRSNYDLSLAVGPAVEYDVYPYSESTRRLLTFGYWLTLNHFNYGDTTILNKTEQTLARQNAFVSLRLSQPWGSVRLGLQGSAHLHLWRRNRLEVFGEFEVRLFRGLSVDLFGSVERLRDQINLPKEGATKTQVILRRRELQTGYRYFTFFGVRYSFGSKYNNIVNPRFNAF